MMPSIGKGVDLGRISVVLCLTRDAMGVILHLGRLWLGVETLRSLARCADEDWFRHRHGDVSAVHRLGHRDRSPR